MRVSYLRALTVLHHSFSSRTPAARAHILGRFLTCPFLRTLRHVPEGGRVLDLGAGHGTFARLAIEAGAASVVAVEPDLRKSLAPSVHPRVRFVAAFDDAVRGEFDLVSVFDVIYRIPRADWDPILERASARLSPGGVLLIKELDPENQLKFAWNRAQERLWDRFFGLTLGEAFNYETRAQIEERLLKAGLVDFRAESIDAGYPHSHVVYTARRP
ncbi:MAG: class I SAM-dependent methyltransferase [Thermoanaerobaculia bacterium]|nr:class I SAM-dependent methyltransferase [Thermoanaerobaculia bacterium]